MPRLSVHAEQIHGWRQRRGLCDAAGGKETGTYLRYPWDLQATHVRKWSQSKVKIGCRLKLLSKHGLLGFQRENYPNRCQLNYLPSWTRKANSRMSPCLKCDIYVSRLTSFPPLSLIIFIFIRIWIWSPRKPTSFMSVLTPPAVTKAPNIHYRGTNLEMWTQGCHLDLLLVRKYQAFSFPLNY